MSTASAAATIAGSQARTKLSVRAGGNLRQHHGRAAGQHDPQCQQLPAQPAGRAQRDAAGRQRPIGLLLAVEFDVEDVVEHHAGRVEQGRCRGEQAERPHADRQERQRLPVVAEGPGGLDEEETHRHVGHGGEDVRAGAAVPGSSAAARRVSRFVTDGGLFATSGCKSRQVGAFASSSIRPGCRVTRHYPRCTYARKPCSMNCFASRPAWSGLSIYG